MQINSEVHAAETQRVEDHATALTRSRYQRVSHIYDWLEGLGLMELFGRKWRQKVWGIVQGPRVLEIGVGTGLNAEFWPSNTHVTAIDLTPGMLDSARRRLSHLNRKADLRLGDVQDLEFASGSFDTAVGTCVFCSVPDPIQGLREVARVVRPGGQVVLLEHVRVNMPVMGAIMDAINPLIVRFYGANINRRTLENIRAAGLHIEQVENMDRLGMFKLIVAKPTA